MDNAFINSFKLMFENYAKFDGRTSLGNYWRAVLVHVLINIVLNGLDSVSSIFALIGLIYSLAVLVPGLAVAVRRLHDTDKSGWLLLLLIIPILGWIALIVLLAQGGTPGPNQYGLPDDADPNTMNAYGQAPGYPPQASGFAPETPGFTPQPPGTPPPPPGGATPPPPPGGGTPPPPPPQ